VARVQHEYLHTSSRKQFKTSSREQFKTSSREQFKKLHEIFNDLPKGPKAREGSRRHGADGEVAAVQEVDYLGKALGDGVLVSG
jgi:hypothetical protein